MSADQRFILTDARQNQIAALSNLAALLSQDAAGDVVLPFMEWMALAGLSETAARVLRARGEGPRVVRLTSKKLGVTLAEHRRWVRSRMEEAAPEKSNRDLARSMRK
jgi:hypothetical protein